MLVKGSGCDVVTPSRLSSPFPAHSHSIPTPLVPPTRPHPTHPPHSSTPLVPLQMSAKARKYSLSKQFQQQVGMVAGGWFEIAGGRGLASEWQWEG